MKSVKILASAAVLGGASVLSLQANGAGTSAPNYGELKALETLTAGVAPGTPSSTICNALMTQSSMFGRIDLKCGQ